MSNIFVRDYVESIYQYKDKRTFIEKIKQFITRKKQYMINKHFYYEKHDKETGVVLTLIDLTKLYRKGKEPKDVKEFIEVFPKNYIPYHYDKSFLDECIITYTNE